MVGDSTIKRKSGSTLYINLNKGLIEKENYGMYTLTITTKGKLLSVENGFNDFKININNMDGDHLILRKSVSDGNMFYLNHCSYKDISINLQHNTYLMVDGQSEIGSVKVFDNNSKLDKLLHTENYSYFGVAYDDAGRILFLTNYGYKKIYGKLNEESFHKSTTGDSH